MRYAYLSLGNTNTSVGEIEMRAMTITAHGGPDVLQMSDSFPMPAAGENEVLIRVEASGVNRMDILVRQGYPGLKLPLPHVCGADIAGRVADIGSSVPGSPWLTVGARVVVYPLLSCGTCAQCRSGRPNLCQRWRSVGMHVPGGYAEYVAIPAENVFPLPDSIEFADAVTLPVAGLTAHHALMTVGRLQKGETVFIRGGAGTLGSMAVQIARNAGARVLATAAGEERLEVLRRLGVDVAIDRNAEEVEKRVAEETDGGVDIVLDPVGGVQVDRSTKMLANGGRLIICGILDGRTAELDIHQTYYHHRSIHGVFLGTREDMEMVTRLLAERRINPLTSTVALEDAAEAHRTVESGRHTGKIVLSI